MSQTMTATRSSDPVRSMDNIGPASDQIGPGPQKAHLRERGPSLIQTTKDAAIRFYGGVKQTAFALGEVDPSLMMREFDAGKFQRLDTHADVDAKAFIAAAQVDAFGPLKTPQARIRQAIREARQRLDDIEQGVEYLAS